MLSRHGSKSQRLNVCRRPLSSRQEWMEPAVNSWPPPPSSRPKYNSPVLIATTPRILLLLLSHKCLSLSLFLLLPFSQKPSELPFLFCLTHTHTHRNVVLSRLLQAVLTTCFLFSLFPSTLVQPKMVVLPIVIRLLVISYSNSKKNKTKNVFIINFNPHIHKHTHPCRNKCHFCRQLGHTFVARPSHFLRAGSVHPTWNDGGR